jgi:copper transport protein
MKSEAADLFGRAAWVLFGLLLVAGMVELAEYAVQASGEPFSLGLFGRTVSESRVGHIWLARLGFAFFTALGASWARREGGWPLWATAGVGGILLLTVIQLSHAAAARRFLPFFSDWLHLIAVPVWMGGLLGFPLLLIGTLRAMPPEAHTELLRRIVRRFSRVATLAVATIVITGAYATLLHVPGFDAPISTAYGRALIMKLGLAALLLATGGINLIDRGKGPFGRMVGFELLLAFRVFAATGFLTSLPPP